MSSMRLFVVFLNAADSSFSETVALQNDAIAARARIARARAVRVENDNDFIRSEGNAVKAGF